jgi:CHAT domain-containing protein
LQQTQLIFQRGDVVQAERDAEKGALRFAKSDSELAWQFRLLQADALLWRGMSQEALAILHTPATPLRSKSSKIKKFSIESVAYGRLHSFPEAESALQEADRVCAASQDQYCGEVLRAHGVLAIEQGQPDVARQSFRDSLLFARQRKDKFMEATALLNLGVASLRQEHFDEAVDWTEAAYEVANNIGAGMLATKALGNLGWAYYNLGDFERSLELSESAEKRAFELRDIIDQLSYLNNSGYVYARLSDYPRATRVYEQALSLATQIKNQPHIYNALRALALVALEQGDLDTAQRDSDQAISIAQQDNNRLNELYPLLVKGIAAARAHVTTEGERILSEVKFDPKASLSLRWRAAHALAQLYESMGRDADADREYRTALVIFESARDTVRREDIQLAFFTNASRIYDDYIHFLVSRGKVKAALGQAEFSRARMLAQGLQLHSRNISPGRPLQASDVTPRCGGAVLFYWLGEKQSYVWLIINNASTLITLPPQKEISAAVQRYRRALIGPRGGRDYADPDGRYLYSQLVAPIVSRIPKNSKIYVIPDGSLNNLNFETLIVPEPQPHFLIEDATIINANSLHLLAASCRKRPEGPPSLLLIGNSTASSERYPELPKAQIQMDKVSSHFQSHRLRIFRREQATPEAYLGSDLEQFTYIHFVAHGTASRLSPLDSAIILSNNGEGGDSFKLYAREIIQHPLKAKLVTISSCYGAGERAYAGEGLVGLSWAFLRAGAHNVIAALWEATDASTERLMDSFYQQIARGVPPESALRNAKLAILHSEFHSPFYWAPFQLYTGS